MRQMHLAITTHRRLLLFKWLMVLIPPGTLVVGHGLLGLAIGEHAPTATLIVTVAVALLALVLAYVFAETMLRVLQGLQAEALAREQDILRMDAVMQERARLSRELHDGVAQLVAHLLLRLDMIKDLVEADRRPEAEAELEQLHGVAKEIYEDIGDAIAGLRTSVVDHGLVHALRDYAALFEERHHVTVTLRTDNAADHLPLLAAFQLFRLIQEALTNVRKHAGAREVTITLTSDGPDRLRVAITDDGQGFPNGSQRNGKTQPLGLTSMRERVAALGGTLQVRSEPGSGTHLTATIPVPRTRQELEYAARATPPR